MNNNKEIQDYTPIISGLPENRHFLAEIASAGGRLSEYHFKKLSGESFAVIAMDGLKIDGPPLDLLSNEGTNSATFVVNEPLRYYLDRSVTPPRVAVLGTLRAVKILKKRSDD